VKGRHGPPEMPLAWVRVVKQTFGAAVVRRGVRRTNRGSLEEVPRPGGYDEHSQHAQMACIPTLGP